MQSNPKLNPSVLEEIETRWRAALPFFKSKKRVVFLSYCRFWEKHAFVQQSLAKLLVDNGIPVFWFDGMGWRSYHPTLYWDSPRLRVQQLFELPGRRVASINRLNTELQWVLLKKYFDNSLIWVQGGLDEPLVEKLPYVDIYSTFDDPFRHPAHGPLCQKAKLVVCQNTKAEEYLNPLREKLSLSFPPVDMDEVNEVGARIELPVNFPSKRMGYIGSFFSSDYDLVLFEQLVRTTPDWGFILAGRTDSQGEKFLRRFKKYPNFVRFDWVPRSHIAPLWRILNVCLLLYRPVLEQTGAYPTKVLEATYFGVPSVATRVDKTIDLEGLFPRSSFVDQIKWHAVQSGSTPFDGFEIYNTLYRAMNPKLHLARAAERLISLS
jgi:glycosyltransferase involved in cell wall biosynthesis